MVLNFIFRIYKMYKEKMGMFLKKICLIVITALTLLVTDLKALPVGNPLDATWLCNGLVWEGSCYEPCDPCLCWQDTWSFRFGYYGDFVFNRYMEVDNHHNRPAIRHTELFTNAAYLAFNVWDRFDVFASLGDSTLRIQTPGSAFFLNTDDDPNNNVLNIELNTHFSWSIGGRATLWECGCFGFGAEAQYFSYKSKVNYVDNAFETPLYLSDAGTKYHEYQFGIGATYQIPIAGCGTFVVPYFAVKW